MSARGPSPAPSRTSPGTPARWLARIAAAFAVLLLLVLGLSFWLLRTESGLGFVLARAVGATDGKLEIGASSGRLSGPVTLDAVRYRDPDAGVDVQVRRVTLDHAPLELLASRLHVTRLEIEGVELALTTVAPDPSQDAGEFSLEAPLDVVLDRLVVSGVQVTQDGAEVARIDSLDVAGRWTHEGIAIRSLALKSPDGTLDLHGTVSALAGYPGNGELRFDWRVQDIAYAGTLQARGDGRVARLELALASPTPATLVADLTQTDAFPWSAKLDVPRFDPRLVQPDARLEALALSLEGSGDRRSGTLAGEVGINGHRVLLDPLRYALAGEQLRIEALRLRSPEAAGVLDANGIVQFDAEPVAATLVLDWNGVELPADLVGQALATQGRLDLSGSAERYKAEGRLTLGPPGQPSDIALRIEGTPQAIALHQLALEQSRGGLDAQGTITLQPAIGWDITARAQRFDPGAYAADWPGALDFDLASKGQLTDNGPAATIQLTKLGGTLR
ncbi:MAG TPA: pathogenicity protein, partial [Dokdonella sp.]